MSARAKGNRNRLKAKKFWEDKGYIVDTVEKTHKFTKVKDLFGDVCGGFDLVALNEKEIILIQVKSNKPATRKDYLGFAEKYGKVVKVLVMTWYDRKGWRHQYYMSTGKIMDLKSWKDEKKFEIK